VPELLVNGEGKTVPAQKRKIQPVFVNKKAAQLLDETTLGFS